MAAARTSIDHHRRVFGRRVKPTTVLYAAAEGERGIGKRIAALARRYEGHTARGARQAAIMLDTERCLAIRPGWWCSGSPCPSWETRFNSVSRTHAAAAAPAATSTEGGPPMQMQTADARRITELQLEVR